MSPFTAMSSAYRLIYIGLVLYVLGIVVLVGGAAIGVAQVGMGAQGQKPAVPADMLMILIVGAVISLIGSAVMLLGKIRCLVVPDEVTGARSLIATAVAFEIFSILVSVVSTVDDAGQMNFLPPVVKEVAGMASGLLGFVAILLFLMFTTRLARYIRRSDLAQAASIVLKIVIGLVLVMVLMMVTAIATVGLGAIAGNPAAAPAPGQAPANKGAMAVGGLAMCGFGLVLLVLGIAGLVLYARLLTNMSKALARFAREGGRDDEYLDDEDDEYDRPRRRRDDDEPEDDFDR